MLQSHKQMLFFRNQGLKLKNQIFECRNINKAGNYRRFVFIINHKCSDFDPKGGTIFMKNTLFVAPGEIFASKTCPTSLFNIFATVGMND